MKMNTYAPVGMALLFILFFLLISIVVFSLNPHAFQLVPSNFSIEKHGPHEATQSQKLL
jgi:hypothetical protein